MAGHNNDTSPNDWSSVPRSWFCEQRGWLKGRFDRQDALIEQQNDNFDRLNDKFDRLIQALESAGITVPAADTESGTTEEEEIPAPSTPPPESSGGKSKGRLQRLASMFRRHEARIEAEAPSVKEGATEAASTLKGEAAKLIDKVADATEEIGASIKDKATGGESPDTSDGESAGSEVIEEEEAVAATGTKEYKRADFEARNGNPNELLVGVDDPIQGKVFVRCSDHAVMSGDGSRILSNAAIQALEDEYPEDVKGRIEFLKTLAPEEEKPAEEEADEKAKADKTPFWRKLGSLFRRPKKPKKTETTEEAEDADETPVEPPVTTETTTSRWAVVNVFKRDPWWLCWGIPILSLVAAAFAGIWAHDRYHKLNYELTYALAAFFIFWLIYGVLVIADNTIASKE